jgi:hypothetical protein
MLLQRVEYLPPRYISYLLIAPRMLGATTEREWRLRRADRRYLGCLEFKSVFLYYYYHHLEPSLPMNSQFLNAMVMFTGLLRNIQWNHYYY